MADKEEFFIPTGYIWSKSWVKMIAPIQWDPKFTCSKIGIESDMVTVMTKEGGGFKSCLGDYVRKGES